MVVQSSSLGVVGGGLLMMLFGGVALGQATWAMQNGAAASDPGMVSMSSGSSQRSRNRPGTAMSYGVQQAAGGVIAVFGLGLAGAGLILPVLLRGDED